jgi:hypothetical protein
MGEGSTELPLPCRPTLTQEAWAFAHPSDQTRRFWFALFTYLRRVNERFNTDGFDYWSDRLFHFPHDLLHWRAFGLSFGNRLRSRSLACLTALS